MIAHTPALSVIEEAAAWSGGVLQASDGLPMAYPGGIDVVYDTVGKQETFEVATRVLKARGTLVKAGVHGPTWWEDTPLYFKEISMVGSNAFGFETVERRAQARHRALPRSRRRAGTVDLTGLLTHTYTLDDWRDAFTTIATQGDTGAIKVAFDFRNDAQCSGATRRCRSHRDRRPRRGHHAEPAGSAQRAEPGGPQAAARRRSRRSTRTTTST